MGNKKTNFGIISRIWTSVDCKKNLKNVAHVKVVTQMYLERMSATNSSTFDFLISNSY